MELQNTLLHVLCRFKKCTFEPILKRKLIAKVTCSVVDEVNEDTLEPALPETASQLSRWVVKVRVSQ